MRKQIVIGGMGWIFTTTVRENSWEYIASLPFPGRNAGTDHRSCATTPYIVIMANLQKGSRWRFCWGFGVLDGVVPRPFGVIYCSAMWKRIAEKRHAFIKTAKDVLSTIAEQQERKEHYHGSIAFLVILLFVVGAAIINLVGFTAGLSHLTASDSKERNALICLGLFLFAALLHALKKRYPVMYGSFEVALGIVINWQAVQKTDISHTTPLERMIVIVGGVYLIKRGIDTIVDKRAKDKTDSGAAEMQSIQSANSGQ